MECLFLTLIRRNDVVNRYLVDSLRSATRSGPSWQFAPGWAVCATQGCRGWRDPGSLHWVGHASAPPWMTSAQPGHTSAQAGLTPAQPGPVPQSWQPS